MKGTIDGDDTLQRNRRILLIEELLREDRKKYVHARIPLDKKRQEEMLKRLLLARPARHANAEFLIVQNLYLQEEIDRRGVMHAVEIPSDKGTICLQKSDITAIECDVAVNSAAPNLLGPFELGPGGVDAEMHSLAGVQLRYECDRIVQMKKRQIMAGEAILTNAYNLPYKYVLHTVVPELRNEADATEDKLYLLGDCYTACLERAAENPGIHSIAFCCLGTGNNRFPKIQAAEVAIERAERYLKRNPNRFQIIFCLYSKEDVKIYRKILNK